MINIVTRGFLGVSGSQFLDFYIKNSLWINALILLYFVLLLLSQRNYRTTLSALIVGLKNKYPSLGAKKTAQEVANFLKKHDIPWEAGLNASRMPLIATPRHLTPRIKSLQTLQRFYPVDLLAQRLAERPAEKAAGQPAAKPK